MEANIANAPYVYAAKDITQKANGIIIFHLFVLIPIVNGTEEDPTPEVTSHSPSQITISFPLQSAGNTNPSLEHYISKKISLKYDLNNQLTTLSLGQITNNAPIEIWLSDTENYEFNVIVGDQLGNVQRSTLVSSHIRDTIRHIGDEQLLEDSPYIYLSRSVEAINGAQGNRIETHIFYPRILVPTKRLVLPNNDSILRKSVGRSGICEGIVRLSENANGALRLFSPQLVNGPEGKFHDSGRIEGGFAGIVFTSENANTTRSDFFSGSSIEVLGNQATYFLEQGIAPPDGNLSANTKKKEIKVSTNSANSFPNNIFLD